MDLSVEELYEGVRAELNDTRKPGGEVFTNDLLAFFYRRAYEELFRRLANIGAGRVRKTLYHLLPVRTGTLSPAQLGVQDFDQPEHVWERNVDVKFVVTGTANGAPVVVTAPGYLLNSSYDVILTGVGAQVNGRWFITPLTADTFSLNGSSSTVSYSGGYVSQSRDKFLPVVSRVDLTLLDPFERLYEYTWDDGIFRFPGSTKERQLRIVYLANGVPPVSGAIGIEDARNFLVARTGGLVAPTKDRQTRGRELMAQANAALGSLIQAHGRNMQRNIYQPPPARPRRNIRLNY